MNNKDEYPISNKEYPNMKEKKKRNHNTPISFTILFLFLCGISTCFASGGNQSLAKVINESTWIVKAKVINVKKVAKKWGHLHIKIKTIETLKGNIKGTSLLLNFQAHVYAETIKHKFDGKITKWYRSLNQIKS
ncbi:MAG: hypothetical protein KOO69_05170 [Victivallales bacterium]|nr:hypothetical protein [Victivallales bacterium]